MKKLGLILIIFLFITPDIPNVKTGELVELTQLVTNLGLTIDEWTVTMKEQVSEDKANKIMNQLKKDHIIHSEDSTDITKYTITSIDPDTDVIITYHVIIPKDKQYSVEFIAIIEGINMSTSTLENAVNELSIVASNYFTEESRVFTCLISTNDGIIKSDDFFKRISQKNEIKYISTQTDTTSKLVLNETLYGYTPIWSNELIVKEKPLNIQVVIQSTKNEKQKVIIGTPILINEY